MNIKREAQNDTFCFILEYEVSAYLIAHLQFKTFNNIVWLTYNKHFLLTVTLSIALLNIHLAICQTTVSHTIIPFARFVSASAFLITCSYAMLSFEYTYVFVVFNTESRVSDMSWSVLKTSSYAVCSFLQGKGMLPTFWLRGTDSAMQRLQWPQWDAVGMSRSWKHTRFRREAVNSRQ